MMGERAERLGEWLEPLVVKELRQSLRGRAFAVFFALMLVACLVISMVAVGLAPMGRSQLGPRVLLAYLIALSVVTFFVIPFGAFSSLLRERAEETWSLLLLTGLGARAIVRGKWVSAMSQGVLFASACAPFVLFSYFLNGVSLFQVVLPLVTSFIWSGFVTAMALGLAGQASSTSGRTGAMLAAGALLGLATFLGVAYLASIAVEGSSILHEQSFQVFSGVMMVVAMGTGRLALEGAAAGLALPSEPASRGPRQALLTFVGLFMLAAIPVFGAFAPRPLAAAIGAILTSLYLVIIGFFAIGEADGWPRRFARDGWLKPGGLRSFTLVIGLLGGCGLVWAGLFLSTSHVERYQAVMLSAPAYPMLYLSLAVIAGRLSALRALGEPRATRLAFLVLVGVGVVSSPLLALLLRGSVEASSFHLFNPIFGLIDALDHGRVQVLDNPRVLSLGVITAGCVVVALAVLRARDVEREV